MKVIFKVILSFILSNFSNYNNKNDTMQIYGTIWPQDCCTPSLAVDAFLNGNGKWAPFIWHFYPKHFTIVVSHPHTLMAGYHARRLPTTGSNLGFSVSTKITSTSGQEEPGIEPAVHNSLLRHRRTFCQ